MTLAGIVTTGIGLWLSIASSYFWATGIVPERDWLRCGYAAYAQGEYGEAEVAFRRALEANATLTEAYEPLAQALYQQQRFSEAAMYYQKAAAVASADTQSRVWLAVGHAWLQLHNLSAAAAAYRQSLTHQPNYRPAQQNLSWVLLKLSEKNKKTPMIRNLQPTQKPTEKQQSSPQEREQKKSSDTPADNQADAQNSESASQIEREQSLSQQEMNQLLKQLDQSEKQLRGRPTKAKVEKRVKTEVKDW